MTNEDRIFIQYVFNKCEENPSLVKEVINAATEGVKSFASKQNDSSSKMAFMMTQILDQYKDSNFGPFKRTDILDAVAPWLDGTEWMKNERNKV